MQHKINKIMSMVLIAIILFINSATVASYAAETYKNATQLESQGTSTNNENVEFDVYYAGGKHSNTMEITSNTEKIYLEVKVKNAGYAENVQIDMSDCNFNISNSEANEGKVQSVDTSKNIVTLNKIAAGNTAKIELNITPKKEEIVDLGLFNKDSKVKMTGTYINTNTKQISIKKELSINAKWHGKADLDLSQSIDKYIPYEIGEKKGLLIQTKVNLNVKDNTLPIKNTEIEAIVPTIEGEKPEEVIVYARKTAATNGERTGINFSKNNYTYDKTSGKVTINTKNIEDKINWIKNDTDEYLITYIYSPEVYEKVKASTVSVRSKITANCELYNSTDTKTSAVTEIAKNYNKKTNNIVNINTNAVEETIAKGYMYANKTASEENKNTTEYNVEYTAEISYAELVDKITITEDSDKFVLEDGTEIQTTLGGNNYTSVKSVKVNKTQFEKILGTEGYINILSNGDVQATINKDSKVNSDGNIQIDLEVLNLNAITMETSNPVAEGQLKIDVKKIINKNVDYSKEQIEKIRQIKTKAISTVSTEEAAIENTNNIDLVETTSKATLSINKTNLSTVVTNEDVEIKAILETDSQDDLLYKNPTINIDLPKYISNINVKSVKTLYEDELKVESVEVLNNGDHKTLKIKIPGTQTKYNDTSSKGLNIVIYADIDVERTTPSIEDKITAVYTNENDVTGDKSTDIKVNFASPKELVTVNSISNYSESGKEITVTGEETQTAQLDIYGKAKTATVQNQIINNLGNEISQVSILGRIPSKDSTNYDSNNSVNNTFDTTLNEEISLLGLQGGYKIYYSTNASATKDLSDNKNNWTTAVTDYSTVKSYLIVLDNNMTSSENISWNYKLNVPEDLGYKNSINSNYKVYMTNYDESREKSVLETKESSTITLETENGPELNVTISSNDVENGGTVTKGQRIRIYVKVENTGSQVLHNVKLEIPNTAGIKYIGDLADVTINDETNCIETYIGDIQAKESKEIHIDFHVVELQKAELIARVYADEFENYFKSDTFEINIEDAELALEHYMNEEGMAVSYGDLISYTLIVSNLTDKDMNNIVVEYELPKDVLKFNGIGENDNISVEYDETNNIVELKIKKILANEKAIIVIKTTAIKTFDDIRTIAKAKVNNKEYKSNVVSTKILKYEYIVTATNPGETYVKNYDEIVSKFTIENSGESILYDTKLHYKLPEGTNILSATIEKNTDVYELELNEDKELEYTISILDAGQKVDLIVNLEVELEQGKEEQEIQSYLETSNERLGNKKSDVLTYIVKKQDIDDNNNNDDNPGTSDDEPSKSIIDGKVWIDANKNGKFDNDEQTVSKLSVVLINKDTGNVQTETITNDRGRYVLEDVKDGNYMVAFLYDTTKYKATEYQKEGVNTSLNSDAIEANITYNGQNVVAGLTDQIVVKGKNIDNIDIGIYEKEKFDLSLEKYVDKITINNDAGVVTYDYTGENKTLVKADIPAKYMPSSTVIIEYSIVVKNEGDIPGYAKKIIDYLPDDLKFNSELNPGAYLGKDGNIYSEELAKTIIQPGESKSIKLILTKKMTNENTGTIVNKAEIAEDYNDLGLKDENSVPGNNNEKENDLGYANAIITVKTGQTVIYTTLVISIIGILAIGIYSIKKYVI